MKAELIQVQKIPRKCRTNDGSQLNKPRLRSENRQSAHMFDYFRNGLYNPILDKDKLKDLPYGEMI